MTQTELAYSVGLLGFTLLALFASSTLGIYLLIRHRLAIRTEVKQLLIEEHLEDVLDKLEEVIHPPKVVNHRHNIHCPSCGRFAKRVLGMGSVVECKHHGVQVRWKDMPIDWAVIPLAEGVTLSTQPVVVSEALPWDEPLPITQPIPILIPDDLSELEELGALI